MHPKGWIDYSGEGPPLIRMHGRTGANYPASMTFVKSQLRGSNRTVINGSMVVTMTVCVCFTLMSRSAPLAVRVCWFQPPNEKRQQYAQQECK